MGFTLFFLWFFIASILTVVGVELPMFILVFAVAVFCASFVIYSTYEAIVKHIKGIKEGLLGEEINE